MTSVGERSIWKVKICTLYQSAIAHFVWLAILAMLVYLIYLLVVGNTI